jgi:hypothetical protein
MENDKARLAQRYRSLVLSHLYLLSRDRNMPMRDIPRQTLERLGVTRSVDAASVTTFRVDIPDNLESRGVREMLGRFERQLEGNPHLFLKKHPAEAKKVRFRARGGGRGRQEPGEWDAEPLDEKALVRMASPP